MFKISFSCLLGTIDGHMHISLIFIKETLSCNEAAFYMIILIKSVVMNLFIYIGSM